MSPKHSTPSTSASAPSTISIGRAVIIPLLAMLLWPSFVAAQTGTVQPTPFQTVFDNSGAIVNAGCVWVYSAGTTTAATTYTDKALAVPNTNPIRSDSAGRFTAYLVPGTTYKFVYEGSCTPPAHGTVLRTADNIDAVPTSSATVDVTGTAGESIAAGLAVYLSDGSGGKSAGQWYKADSANTYSSTTNWVGVVPSAIASGASGTIRLAGSVTGLSSLAAGSIYYVGTAGALTSTAPTNARKLGEADTTTSLVVTANPPAGAGAGCTTYTAQTISYAAVVGNFVDNTSGSNTVTLPAASASANRAICVVNSGAGTVTVARTGADVIGNQAETSQTLNPGDEQSYYSDGTSKWRIF